MIDPKLKTKYFAPKLKKDYEYFAKRLKEFEKKKKVTPGLVGQKCFADKE